jgi:hypothetical protein
MVGVTSTFSDKAGISRSRPIYEYTALAERTADEAERTSHLKMAVQWDQLAARMSDLEARRKR